MAIVSADGSKTIYTFSPEVVAGTPVAGAYQALRAKAGVKFDLARNTFASQDLRSDRQESALVYGTKSGTVSIPIEWSYGTYDVLMEAVMGGTWTADVLKIGNTARTFSFEETASDIGITELIKGTQFGEMSFSQKVDAIAEGTISGMCRDVQIAQTKGVNIAVDSTAKTITRATAGFNTVDGFPLVTAGVPVLKVSMKGNTDAGNNDTVWTVTTLTDTVMTMTTMAGAVTKTTTAGVVVNQASIASSVVAATSNTPFDSFSGSITEGGAVIGHVTGWDMKVAQEVKPNFALGSDAAQSVSVGTIKVTGNITVYYVDQAMRKKFANGVGTSLSLVMGKTTATGGNGKYTFDLGTVKYSSNSRDNSAAARIETLAFTATYDVTNGSTLKITRAA